jgi:hypothetical protein
MNSRFFELDEDFGRHTTPSARSFLQEIYDPALPSFGWSDPFGKEPRLSTVAPSSTVRDPYPPPASVPLQYLSADLSFVSERPRMDALKSPSRDPAPANPDTKLFATADAVAQQKVKLESFHTALNDRRLGNTENHVTQLKDAVSTLSGHLRTVSDQARRSEVAVSELREDVSSVSSQCRGLYDQLQVNRLFAVVGLERCVNALRCSHWFPDPNSRPTCARHLNRFKRVCK